MEKTQLIIFSAAMAFLAFRIYQKYVVKSKGKSYADQKDKSGPVSSASSESDDYEPYSKK